MFVEVCRETLLKIISHVHAALVCTHCLCRNASGEEEAFFSRLGVVLAVQLRELRAVHVKWVGVDPLGAHGTGHDPAEC